MCKNELFFYKTRQISANIIGIISESHTIMPSGVEPPSVEQQDLSRERTKDTVSVKTEVSLPQIPQKRTQVKVACGNQLSALTFVASCRKACKKCDEQRPCQRCIKYNIVCYDSAPVKKEPKKGISISPSNHSRLAGKRTVKSMILYQSINIVRRTKTS